MERILSAVLFATSALYLGAQTNSPVLVQEPGRITFAVDEVGHSADHCGWHRGGKELAQGLHLNTEGDLFSDWKPTLLANSFADDGDLYDIGEDVLFQMLLKAWCQHRPVVLGPDAIWLVICQQVSHCIHADPQQYRDLLVRHEGKKELKVRTSDLLSEQADWAGLMPDSRPRWPNIRTMISSRRSWLIFPLRERMN
ncbi:MAG: DUF4419 domain-containing protein [Bacteroidales bacterium]|nr:DUF4419 domain-containing protein [Bacteroidales bacterium]